ncbi:uncharacterized protein FOMMEDRAFT_142582 [Fomitiporia mediterranea MF3/22]|uniref:uncharacterized protein n=1 Tax=Fomitiporia mediterranea (strain MF3/22) TaxID=694068 RepID=UPI00044098B0|nr:uncharacterized protein FOMMEDRAFT_142582 [Fomitiporia mediterranea MF3/22]EJD00203.1 hypothetical protein FOMMEDRAFT_142582 [Fomitiporia mediterranea MF3/22]
MVGGDDSLKAPLYRCMLRAAALEGMFYVAGDGSDAIHTVAIWFAPGVKFLGSAEQREAGFNELFASLPQAAKDWWMNDYRKTTEDYLNSVIGQEKILNSWYCNTVATDPVHQRKGYGSALVNAVQKRAKESHDMMVLGTTNEKNIAWYESLGFKSIGKVNMSAPTGDFSATYLTCNA